jgi:hypothetical protein
LVDIFYLCARTVFSKEGVLNSHRPLHVLTAGQ